MKFTTLCCVLTCFYFVSAQNEGDSCTLAHGGEGICTQFDNCHPGFLKQKSGEPIKLCSFDSDAIVCCPSEKPSTSTNIPSVTRSKSYEKCKEYSGIKCKVTTTHTIHGGEKVESPTEFPHMVLLGYGQTTDNEWNCGGSLISEQYILTAAHCTSFGREKIPVSVAHMGFLNKNNRNQFNSLQTFNIAKIINHPDRDAPRKYHDIALLKLDRPVNLTDNVIPACLHEEYDIRTSTLIATGWGSLEAGSKTSDDLMKVNLKMINPEDCKELYPSNRNLKDGIRDKEQFCAGDTNKDTCPGDSGGPLQIYRDDFICMQDVIGVTSSGGVCGSQPGVYTRVSEYVAWIESVVWP